MISAHRDNEYTIYAVEFGKKLSIAPFNEDRDGGVFAMRPGSRDCRAQPARAPRFGLGDLGLPHVLIILTATTRTSPATLLLR
jgi:hypothetical protein